LLNETFLIGADIGASDSAVMLTCDVRLTNACIIIIIIIISFRLSLVSPTFTFHKVV